MREQAVLDWIDAGLISYVTMETGEHRIQLLDEQLETSGPLTSSFTFLELSRGIDPETREIFAQEQRRRRRELELEGLDYGAIDVSALTTLIATRLAAVVPDPCEVTVYQGMVYVGGAGIDVARIIGDGDNPSEERIRLVGERALEIASESLSEVTMDPWPAKPRQFPGGFPPCNALITDGQLNMSYGDPSAPVLTLAPISLADLSPL